MTRIRAALWALLLLAVAFPAASGPVLGLAVEAVAWLGGQPTLTLTAAALTLTGWATRPHRTTQVPGGPQ